MKRHSLLCIGCVVVLFASCKKEEATATPNPTTQKTAPTTGPGLGGMYNISSSTNPGGGGGYTGVVEIAPGAVNTVKWTLPGSPPYSGVGIVVDNVLGVGWGIGANYGVVVYKLNGDKLDGKWATAATGNFVGTEMLAGPEGLNGTYTITAATTPSGGGTYKGNVEIAPTGDTYSVKWTLESGASYAGVGIKTHGLLVVGWGASEKNAGTVSYDIGEGKLDGKWAQPGGTALGTEVLKKQGQ